jgi:hypothetical protein
VFHHKLGHGTAADVAVTDEEDFYHVEVLIVEVFNCCADSGTLGHGWLFCHKTYKTAKTFFMVGKQPTGLLSSGDAVARRSHFSLGFCMFCGFCD